MKRVFLVCFLLGLVWSAAAFPYVNGAATLVYTNVIDPMLMSFAPDGTLFVGRDARGSGGDAYDPVFVSKVGPNASSVGDFGNTVMKDPDAVGYDPLGLVSGTPGALLVGGNSGNNTAFIYKVMPDGTVSTLFGGNLSDIGNPRQILFHPAGRVYISDSINGSVVSTASSSPPTLFCAAPEAHGIAFDANGRLAVTAVTPQKIRIYSYSTIAQIAELQNLDFPVVKADAPIVTGPGDAFWGSDLYSVNTAGQLIRIDLQGTAVVLGDGYGGQVELAFGPDNALYVSERSTDRVYRIKEKNVVLPQPIHWWPGDGDANDIIGGAHGFLAAAEGYSTNSTTPKASYPAGVLGQCFLYETNGTAFNFGTNTANVGTNDFTLSFWFNSTNNFARGLFGKQTTCNYFPGWSINLLGDGKLRFVMAGAGPQTSTEHVTDGPATDGQWHHFAMVRLQTNCFVYMDGALQLAAHGGGSTSGSTATTVNLNNEAQFTMGGANGTPATVSFGWCYQARNQGDRYDEVQFYDTALDAEQIGKLATVQTTYSGQFSFRPKLVFAPVANALRLTWPTNRVGFVLQTNGSLVQPNGWGVLSTNYSVISTNFTVTISTGETGLFYRLSKP